MTGESFEDVRAEKRQETKKEMFLMLLGWFGGSGVVSAGTLYTNPPVMVAFWAAGLGAGILAIGTLYITYRVCEDRLLKHVAKNADDDGGAHQ